MFDHKDHLRKKDLKIINRSFGSLLVILPLILYLLISEHARYAASILNPGHEVTLLMPKNEVLAVYEITRLSYFLVLIVLGCGGAVHILRKYKINYVHIFGIQPYFQLTHYQLYSQGMLLFTIFAAFLLLQLASEIFGISPDNRLCEPAVLCFGAFLMYLMLPFDHF